MNDVKHEHGSKPACKQCPLPNKSEGTCIRRRCEHADLPPLVLPEAPESKWHIRAGNIIGDHQIQLHIIWVNENNGNFKAQVVELNDPSTEPGHLGSYVTEGRYYGFECIDWFTSPTMDKAANDDPVTWEIPETSTERFHREGSVGAQFLMGWSKENGFTVDLDS